MKILEIKNNLVKIGYDVSDNLALSEFLIIEDSNSPYVAQIMNVKTDALNNFVIAKLLFTFNEEGILKNYNGTIPSLKATVSKLPANELLDIIPVEEPLFLGNIAQQNIPLKVDKSILDNNLLICSDNLANTSELLTNITRQLSEKTVIFDTMGQFDTNSKVVFGRDFKLPLNSKAIDFIYENDLEDVDAVNKAVIQDIFLEVQDYIKTLPEQFLPFDTFLNVVDSQYQETKIPELVLLKNKLLKYKELNVFAQDLKDVLSLSIVLEKSDLTVLDISNVPDTLKRALIEYVYSVMNTINEKFYAFAKVNNDIITKRLLKRFIDRDNVYTTVICPHEFKYISEIKESSQNMIFFAPLTVTHDFGSYNAFLSKLNADEFVVYGAHTQNIPLIVEIAELPVNDNNEGENTENFLEESTFPNVDFSDENDEETPNDEEETEEEFQEPEQETPEELEISDENFSEEEYTEPQIVEEESVSEPEIVEGDVISEQSDFFDDDDYNNVSYTDDIQETEEKKIPNQVIFDDIDENPLDDVQIVEQVEPVFDEVSEPDVQDEPVVEPLDTNDTYLSDKTSDIPDFLNESEDYIPQENEELVEQVAKDVDKMFYEKLPQEDDVIDETPEIVEDELTDEDLNIIDELSSDEIQLAGSTDVPELSPSFEDDDKPPIVPIYPADDIDDGDGKVFKPGDRVSTPKFGEGVVNKMVKYGNKMLCYVDFPNIGKRLMDPAITEITKIDEM